MNKILFFGSILVILGLLFSACGPTSVGIQLPGSGGSDGSGQGGQQNSNNLLYAVYALVGVVVVIALIAMLRKP